jgi:flavin reductase (DIM6/NTAB) family NADH-FMN oxidoreductase RutF
MSADGPSAVFARLDPPVWVVTADDGNRRGGLIATFVGRASIVADLPRVMLGIARQHHTWGLIEAAGVFALHLLDAQDLAWCLRFGLGSGRDVDKLAGLMVRPGPLGVPILAEASSWLACRVEERLDAGDRTLYLAEVVDGIVVRDGPPLTATALRAAASDEQRAWLDRAYQEDTALDRAAILQWRAVRGG